MKTHASDSAANRNPVRIDAAMPSRQFSLRTTAQRRVSVQSMIASASAPSTRMHESTREAHAASIARWIRGRPKNGASNLPPPKRSPDPAASSTALVDRPNSAAARLRPFIQNVRHRIVHEPV
jgi:hypothetical protein